MYYHSDHWFVCARLSLNSLRQHVYTVSTASLASGVVPDVSVCCDLESHMDRHSLAVIYQHKREIVRRLSQRKDSESGSDSSTRTEPGHSVRISTCNLTTGKAKLPEVWSASSDFKTSKEASKLPQLFTIATHVTQASLTGCVELLHLGLHVECT